MSEVRERRRYDSPLRRQRAAERTVYRHFATERELRDAVMCRLEEEAGIDLHGLRLEDVAAITARMFEYVSSFPIAPRTPRDPTVEATNQRQRDALSGAVAPWTTSWPDVDRTIAAAMLDVLVHSRVLRATGDGLGAGAKGRHHGLHMGQPSARGRHTRGPTPDVLIVTRHRVAGASHPTASRRRW